MSQQLLSYHLLFVGGIFHDSNIEDLVRDYLYGLTGLPNSVDLHFPLFLLANLSNDEELITHVETLAMASS